MDFVTEVKVRGYHEDRFGHVNNARYLELLEEGRWDYLETHGPQGGFQSVGVFPVVVHLDVSYRRPASAGDRLRILTRVAEVGSRRIVMHQEIRHSSDDKVCCEADVTVVLLDAESGRPRILDQAITSAWPDLRQD